MEQLFSSMVVAILHVKPTNTSTMLLSFVGLFLMPQATFVEKGCVECKNNVDTRRCVGCELGLRNTIKNQNYIGRTKN